MIADELNTLVCMRGEKKNEKKKKNPQKRCLLPWIPFLPVLVPVMAEIALCVIVIVSVNKPFTALFLFKLFPGKPTGTFLSGLEMTLRGPTQSNI